MEKFLHNLGLFFLIHNDIVSLMNEIIWGRYSLLVYTGSLQHRSLLPPFIA